MNYEVREPEGPQLVRLVREIIVECLVCSGFIVKKRVGEKLFWVQGLLPRPYFLFPGNLQDGSSV